ncbi:MAG: hypothetical protein PHQ58_14325 [Rhodoferax sp.]|uniref:hypothetical protein n=1 Tax=Rhodoferax sp. TaxID=50421 RepID=UPI0026280638|nr:hypothetical protein [Rhodoferax sp.]MDD2881602.1 hypothetical protein [Rhodoferax sp.]
MAHWTAFPYAGEYNFDAKSVKTHWARLHAGDLEPLPQDAKLLNAWAKFHNGEFQKATVEGLNLGLAGLNVANKATCVYANYLEKHEACRLEMFLDVAKRAEQQINQDPDNVNAYYWHAYALGRYSQGLSVAKALAQGIGNTVKTNLETVIKRQPNHVDAHIALGAFHAEVIDKVGSLIGAMAYGAHRDTGMNLFDQALKLQAASAAGMIEYAHAMLMLDGEKMMSEANRLYQLAAGAQPVDAMEHLDMEMARTELTD